MHRFFVPQLYSEEMAINGKNAWHISKVLRMQPGMRIQIVSDDGIRAVAEIVSMDAEEIKVRCCEKLQTSNEAGVEIVLAQGIAKGEKMDFIVQKAVELGVAEIIPVLMEHTVVRLDNLKADKKAQRWQKIAEAAAKQSKRDFVPKVKPVMTFENMLAAVRVKNRIIAYECEDRLGLKTALQNLKAENGLGQLLVIIGPEGGISERELELAKSAGTIPVSLGRRILRVETAGLAAVVAVLYESGDLGD